MEEGYKTNLLKRIFTSIVIILPIVAILLSANIWAFSILIVAISLLALAEWIKSNLNKTYLGFFLIINFIFCSIYLVLMIDPYPFDKEFLFFVYGTIILNTAIFDTFAYLIGSNIGKTFIAKEISPNKTLEGLVGGSLASASLGALIGYSTTSPIFILYFIIGGMFAFLGDLLISFIKRQSGVKDTGSILPGHGGILDRLDSHLIATPVMIFLFLLW